MSGYEVPILQRTFKAAGDLSTKQYHFVKFSAADTVTVCTAITDKPCGVLQNKPDAANKPAEVMIIGITKISADAAITLPNYIATSSDGQAQTAVATQYPVGQALVAAATAGDVVTAFVCCAGATVIA